MNHLEPTVRKERRAAAVVALVALILALLACGGEATPSATDTPAGPTATFDLSFNETFDSLGNWASESNKEVIGSVSDVGMFST